jgi:hypothetical protein
LRVLRVDASPSEIVAVTTPVVLPAVVFAFATDVFPERVTASLPKPVIPFEE